MRQKIKTATMLLAALAVTSAGSAVPTVRAETVTTAPGAAADSKALLERIVQALVKETDGTSIREIAAEHKAKEVQDGVDLAAVGTSYTAARLAPLSAADFTIAGLTVGKPAAPTEALFPYQTSVTKGPFVTFSGSNGPAADDEIDLGFYITRKGDSVDDKAHPSAVTTATTVAEESAATSKTAPDTAKKVKTAEPVALPKKDDEQRATPDAKADKAPADASHKTDGQRATPDAKADKAPADASHKADEQQATPDAKADKATLTNSFTFYNGLWNRREQGNLRAAGLTYEYRPQTVTDIHVEDGLFQTPRHIGVGNRRSEVLFAYGSPQAMMQRSEDGAVLLIYAADMAGEKSIAPKKEFGKAAENVGSSRVVKAPTRTYRYIVFTVVKGKVTAVDMVDGQVWPSLSMPTTLHYFAPNSLSAEDFVLGGYAINDSFNGAPDEQWQKKGRLYGDEFISYRNWLISYDERRLISRVLVSSSGGVTRRGISIGDTKYLMLYLYGMPTSIAAGEGKEQAGTTVYTYKNPLSDSSYLLFIVGDKEGFIKEIILSDRPNHALRREV